MPSLTVATFNVENLFARAKLLNFKHNETGTPKLALVDDLKAELSKETFNATAIQALREKLKGYITIEDTRGKLFDRSGKLVAKGRDEWDGFIQLTRAEVSEEARKNTARVLRDVDADIVSLVEVENRLTLRAFMQDRMSGKSRYPHVMCIDGNDARGIDVAVISKYPLGTLRSHVDDRLPKARTPIFSRDCLEVEVLHPTGSVWLLLNHFKSKGYGAKDESDAKRKQQATRVSQIVSEGYTLKKERVIVAGDLNDTPDSAPLAPLLTTDGLADVFDVAGQAADDRWTYHYKSNQQIDYLLVSKPLQSALTGVRVFRRGIWEVEKFSGGTETPYPGMTHWTHAASDHAAIVAEFAV